VTENSYSPEWYATFADRIPGEETDAEVRFLAEIFPPPAFPKLVDLCCGKGRHSIRLARRGYAVTGVDANPDAIEEAREEAERARLKIDYIEGDIREVPLPLESFDGAMIMWQSFGYFSEEQNEEIAGKVAGILRPGGRFVLDIYNRDYFARNLGKKTRDVGGVAVTATTTLSGSRLKVKVAYGDGGEGDSFDWRVYRSDEIVALGERCGFALLRGCADFSFDAVPNDSAPRMQIVLEKR
jgi:SAM-dependent methyltransferase